MPFVQRWAFVRYCEACLIEMNQSAHLSDESIRCPCCPEVTEGEIKQLKTNYFLVRLVKEAALSEALKDKTNQISCSVCSKAKATNYCFDCAEFLCPHCRMVHDRLPASSEHKVLSLEECREGKMPVDLLISDGVVNCAKHNKKCKYFCKTCQELVCQECMVLDHPLQSHTYTDLKMAAAEGKKTMQSLLSRLEPKLPEMETSLGLFKQLDLMFKRYSKETIAEVQACADKIREEVTAQEKHLIHEIRREAHQKTNDVNLTCKNLRETITSTRFSLEAGAVFTKKSTNSEFLWLRSIVENDLEWLVDKQLPSLPKMLKFLEDENDVILGELEETDSKQFIQKYMQEMRSSSRSGPLRGTSQRRMKEEDASRKENAKTKPEDTENVSRQSNEDEKHPNPSEKSASSTKPKTNPDRKLVHDQCRTGSQHSRVSTEMSKSAGKTKTSTVPPSDRVLRSSSKTNEAKKQQLPTMTGQNWQGNFASLGGDRTSSLFQGLGATFRFTPPTEFIPTVNKTSQNMENVTFQQQRAPFSSSSQSGQSSTEFPQDGYDGAEAGSNKDTISQSNQNETDSDDSDL